MLLHCRVTNIIDVGNFWAQIGSASDFDEFRALENAVSVYCNGCRNKQGYNAPELASLHHWQTVFVPLLERKLQHRAIKSDTGMVWCRAQVQLISSEASKKTEQVDVFLVDYGWSQPTSKEWIVSSCPQWMFLFPAFAQKCGLAHTQQLGLAELWSSEIVERFRTIVTSKKLFAQHTPVVMPAAGSTKAPTADESTKAPTAENGGYSAAKTVCFRYTAHVSLWATELLRGDEDNEQGANGRRLQLVAEELVPLPALPLAHTGGGGDSTADQFADNHLSAAATCSAAAVKAASVASSMATDCQDVTSSCLGNQQEQAAPAATAGAAAAATPLPCVVTRGTSQRQQPTSIWTEGASQQEFAVTEPPTPTSRQGVLASSRRTDDGKEAASRCLQPEPFLAEPAHVAATASPVTAGLSATAVSSLVQGSPVSSVVDWHRSPFASTSSGGKGRGLMMRELSVPASPFGVGATAQASVQQRVSAASPASPTTGGTGSSPAALVRHCGLLDAGVDGGGIGRRPEGDVVPHDGRQGPAVTPGLLYQGRPGTTAVAVAPRGVGRAIWRDSDLRLGVNVCSNVSSGLRWSGADKTAAGASLPELAMASAGREQVAEQLQPTRQPFPFTEMGEDEESDGSDGLKQPSSQPCAGLDSGSGQAATNATEPMAAAAPAGQQLPAVPLQRFGEQMLCVACGSAEHRRCGTLVDLFC